MSDRTQTPEAPEAVRTPAVALDPAPAAPVGGLALAQLGSVEAVLALQQSSGNQAVNRVLRGQADTGEATLLGALGAALVAPRPAAKPAARKRAAGNNNDAGPMLRDAVAGNLAPEVSAAQNRQTASAVDAETTTATASRGGGGFGGGGGFVDPGGLDGGVATYGGTAGATTDHKIAAGAGAGGGEGGSGIGGGEGGSGIGGGDAGSGIGGGDAGSGGGDAGTQGVDGGATGAGTDAGALGDDGMDADVHGDGGAGAADAGIDGDGDAGGDGGEAGSGGRSDPERVNQLIRLRAHRQAGTRAVGDYFAEENAGATAWADPCGGNAEDRAGAETTRENWARQQRGHAAPQRHSAQLPGPPVDSEQALDALAADYGRLTDEELMARHHADARMAFVRGFVELTGMVRSDAQNGRVGGARQIGTALEGTGENAADGGADALERDRQVDAFRRLTDAGQAETAVAERTIVTADAGRTAVRREAENVTEKEAARARNDAALAQLLAWSGQHREARDGEGQ